MNKNLTFFDDNVIYDQNLKIFPTSLWKACNENPETYDIVKKVFEKLEEKGFSWFIKLNGLVQLGSHIVVSVTSVLQLHENLDKKISLLSKLNKLLKQHLICEEDIKYDQTTYKKEYEFNTLLIQSGTKVKTDLIAKNVNCRIEANGILLVNNKVWTTPQKATEVIEISEKLKKLFPNEKFMYSNPGINFVTSILTSSDEQLYHYCYNMCQYLNVKHSDVTVEYHADIELFKFNEVLLIHPRSFFHLQNMDNVVAVLKKFKAFKKNYDSFTKDEKNLSKKELAKRKQRLENEEKEFCKELFTIKKEERVETDFIREKFLSRISAVIQKPNTFNRIKDIGKINQMDANKPFHGLEDVQIQGEFIFRNGNTNGFVNIDKKKGTTKFAYKNNKIIEAIEMADKLEERFKCKNLSDFQSLIEILTSYESFCKKQKKTHNLLDMPKQAESKVRHEKINMWLERMQELQDKQKKYKYGNALKALHHWMKHPEGFNDLEHLYQELSDFFENTDYEIQLDTQNGKFFSRRYSNEKYFGVYNIACDEKEEENLVATFWCTQHHQKEERKIQENLCHSRSSLTSTEKKQFCCTRYLVITDIEFTNFTADQKIRLNNDIVVKNISRSVPSLFTLNEQIQSGEFEEKENIEIILLFLTKTIKNENMKIQNDKKNKIYTELDYALCLEKLKRGLENKFGNDKCVILCYVDNTVTEKVEILKNIATENFKVQEIDEFMIEDEDAAGLKEFLESTLGIGINNKAQE